MHHRHIRAMIIQALRTAALDILIIMLPDIIMVRRSISTIMTVDHIITTDGKQAQMFLSAERLSGR